MRMNQITFPVYEMKAAVEFYQKMGFELIVDTPHYARFHCLDGDASFSLSLQEKSEKNTSTIYFEHEHLDELVLHLVERGFVFDQMPTDQTYLWREAILHDPSGNQIKLFWAGNNRLYPPWRVKKHDQL
ncbi:glyoxalase/dioxygenase superfamily protein [Shewanella sediminis HAW-EB3]|uniref:Glyoxalase/dioxygenase superfamily protein n=1 Tax=Shewanella sediminis (strain HAW-EB3) TaxID=425104 RepID=A8FRY1_SHESH|nr:VOC family protein [Shewanella sediminis]ABV35604.1 glyoxalase/dioxygenase superfamily protein [Shewanella sediminis HAW-EB3]